MCALVPPSISRNQSYIDRLRTAVSRVDLEFNFIALEQPFQLSAPQQRFDTNEIVGADRRYEPVALFLAEELDNTAHHQTWLTNVKIRGAVCVALVCTFTNGIPATSASITSAQLPVPTAHANGWLPFAGLPTRLKFC